MRIRNSDGAFGDMSAVNGDGAFCDCIFGDIGAVLGDGVMLEQLLVLPLKQKRKTFFHKRKKVFPQFGPLKQAK